MKEVQLDDEPTESIQTNNNPFDNQKDSHDKEDPQNKSKGSMYDDEEDEEMDQYNNQWPEYNDDDDKGLLDE